MAIARLVSRERIALPSPVSLDRDKRITHQYAIADDGLLVVFQPQGLERRLGDTILAKSAIVGTHGFACISSARGLRRRIN